MQQRLLAERFQLVVHHSSKEAAVYALLVAKGGPKLVESAKETTPSAISPEAPSQGTPGPEARVTVGKDGMPQIPKGAARGNAIMMMVPGGRMRMILNGATMARFVDSLAGQLDRPLVDMTGLAGTYDIVLDFTPDAAGMQAKMAAMGVGPPPGMTPGMPQDGRGPGSGVQNAESATIFTALPGATGTAARKSQGSGRSVRGR
jgi:uncharacterized protein (TIGR03435 family)